MGVEGLFQILAVDNGFDDSFLRGKSNNRKQGEFRPKDCASEGTLRIRH